jgi:hypothetical protein
MTCWVEARMAFLIKACVQQQSKTSLDMSWDIVKEVRGHVTFAKTACICQLIAVRHTEGESLVAPTAITYCSQTHVWQSVSVAEHNVPAAGIVVL